MELKVYDIKGQDTGRSVTLDDAVFGITPHEGAVFMDVKHYLAAQRQGTHKAKERAEVARTTKKLKKQKGTGGARAGSMKSPVFVGGGRVFGPRSRDYSFKLNRKFKALARKSILSAKAAAGAIRVVEDFTLAAPNTKAYVEFLAAQQLPGKKSLLVLDTQNKNVYLSGRNIPGASVATVDLLNTYAIINTDALILSEKSVQILNQTLGQEA